MKKALLLMAVLCLPAMALDHVVANLDQFFTTRYVAQAAGVFVGGSACNGQTAITPASFNAVGLSPGDLTYLCGTITGSYHANILIPNGNGNAGNQVTIALDSGAILQSPVCAPDGGGTGNGGCISLFNHSFITIDGGANGIIQNTDNGDALGHHCNTSGAPNSDCLTTLIDGFGCNTCKLTGNLSLQNAYVKVLNNTATGVGGDQQHALTMSGSHWDIGSGVHILDCGWCIFDNYSNGDTDINVHPAEIAHFGHAMMFATANASAAATFFRFYNIHIHDPNNWTTPSCTFHNDGLHTFGLLVSPNSMDQLYLHDNWFNGTWGHCATGFIYIEKGSSQPSHAQNWAAWNNVGDYSTETTWDNTNGWFGMFSGDSGSQYFLNNTLIGPQGVTSQMKGYALQTLSNLTFKNNVTLYVSDPIEMNTIPTPTANNNFYGPADCFDTGNCFVWNGSYLASFQSWRTSCSCDAASAYADAKTDVSLGSDVNIVSNVLTIKTLLNTFLPGQVASFRSFSGSTFLNGTSATLTSATSSQFVAPYTHADVSNTENGVTTIDPLVNTDGSPKPGSQIIGLGANLSALATGELAGLQNDTTKGGTRVAVPRPGGAIAWDAGAYSSTAFHCSIAPKQFELLACKNASNPYINRPGY